MKITLYLIDRIFDFSLPSEISGSFSFDVDFNEENKLINIEAREHKWVLYSTTESKIVINNSYVEAVELEATCFYEIVRNDKKYVIYVSNKDLPNIFAYQYSTNLNLLIGTVANANILYDCPLLNNAAIRVGLDEAHHLILEKNANFPLYVNKINRQEVKYPINIGDEIELYGLRIYFLNGIILVNNVSNKLKISLASSGLTEYNFPTFESPQDKEIKDTELYNKNDYFSKSPRIRRMIEKKTIKLSAPPKEGDSKELPIILVVGPMLTMGVTAGVTLMNTLSKLSNNQATMSDSWPQLVTSGAMLISMLIWPLITQVYNRRIKARQKQEIITKYSAYLEQKKEELRQEAKLQTTILLENLITVDECIKIIENKGIGFWDKRIDQSDFLTVRIGLGNELLNVDIEYPEEGFTIEESELRDKADKVKEMFKYIRDVPIGYSFYDNKTTAIMGTRYKSVQFMHNVILQLITFYSYEDLKIVLFTNENNAQDWEYLRYLNHSFNNEKSFRFFASDLDSSKALADYLNIEINNRMASAKDKEESKQATIKPHYFIIIDDYEQVKRFNFVGQITETDANLGFSLAIIEEKLSRLPSKCNNFITLGTKSSGVLKNSYENQEQVMFTDEVHYQLNMMKFAKILSNVPIEFEDGIKQLPDAITFLEMEKIGKVEQLNILNRWMTNDATTSLKAEVGVNDRGDLMFLDLHEKYHGPHGLIAGMTGSGKSEFIITYILSMAINYSPDDVAFILIDYKGGGLAGAFENKVTGISLPHLAGTITNLDKAEMDRTLVSIDSEIKHRQAVFNEARDALGESTIDIYKYQRFYKEGRLKEAVPHLFIICDEFAELKSQQPDFMDNLISVARIGRSLGVHLILATQKPSGVVNDQIWSNTKFRVCLKVQDAQDSREMLKRPEAASLKQTGRFYLQVGYDEYFALGQSAWCGAKYYPSEKIVKQVNKSVDFINNCGQFIKSIQASSGINIAPQGEQLAAIMNSIIEVSNRVNKRARRLWLENIPEVIIVKDIEVKYQIQVEPYQIEAVMGEYDAPEEQSQGLVKYNYLEDGNTIIYGSDSSEYELFLNTLIYSTAKNHSSEEVNFYVIDYGSESLRRYQKLPHVGGMVFASEDDKYNNLLKMLKEELQRRKKLFADFGGEYKNYIANGNEKLPLKVIILNNYDSIYETNPSIYEEIPDLIRDSERYGIVFIFTANAVNSVQTKIVQNCPNTYTFKLKDESDYTTVFASRVKTTLRNIFGRGLFKKDKIHEFQTASVVYDSSTLNTFIMDFVEEQKEKNQIVAKRIPILPDVVRLNDVKQEAITLHNVPVGIGKNDLEIYRVDYLMNLGNIITSNRLANTITFVKSFVELFKTMNNTCLIVLDPMSLLSLDKAKYPNYYTDHFDDVFTMLMNYITKLKESKSNTEGLIIIYGINKVLSKLSDKNKMVELTKLVKEYEKIGMVLVDDASKIKSLVFETWFTGVFSVNDGIWIGKGLSDQNVLHLSNITKEMTKDYKNDMGYVVSESTGTLCKLIDFISGEEDLDEK